MEKLREQAGDVNDKHWRMEWAIAMQRFLAIAVREETKADTLDKLDAIFAELKSQLNLDDRGVCLSGLDGLQVLLDMLLDRFTSIKAVSIPSMVREFSVKVDTDFGTWLREFKRLVEGAHAFRVLD